MSAGAGVHFVARVDCGQASEALVTVTTPKVYLASVSEDPCRTIAPAAKLVNYLIIFKFMIYVRYIANTEVSKATCART
jgi:hypothetical protein